MKKFIYKNRYRVISALTLLFLIGLWELSSYAVGLQIVFPPFSSVVLVFFQQFSEVYFYQAVGSTLLRCLVGYLISLILGAFLGIVAGRVRTVAAVMHPIVSVMRAVPVVAITLILNVMINSDILPAVVGFMLVFPIIYQQVKTAAECIDPVLIDASREMGAGFWFSMKNVYVPLSAPHILSSISSTFGMNVKAVVSAEFVANTTLCIGFLLQYQYGDFLSKTATLFALALFTVIISVVLEFALKKLCAYAVKRIEWAAIKSEGQTKASA